LFAINLSTCSVQRDENWSSALVRDVIAGDDGVVDWKSTTDARRCDPRPDFSTTSDSYPLVRRLAGELPQIPIAIAPISKRFAQFSKHAAPNSAYFSS
jgi:hypothetical protein